MAHTVSQLRLGFAYENGDFGRAIDLEMALMWFKKAAEGGDHDAQRRLGCAYEEGEEGALGLKTDFDMAHMWYQKAAEGGDEEEEEEQEDEEEGEWE